MSYLKSLPKDTADVTVTQYGNKRVVSDETRAKISKANKGKNKGKTVSAETRAKLSRAGFARTIYTPYVRTEESIAKYTATRSQTYNGKTYQQWADFLGVSRATIYNRIYRFGTPHKLEHKSGKSHGSTKTIYRGKTAYEWAENYGVGDGAIRKHLKDHGNLTQLRKLLKSIKK